MLIKISVLNEQIFKTILKCLSTACRYLFSPGFLRKNSVLGEKYEEKSA